MIFIDPKELDLQGSEAKQTPSILVAPLKDHAKNLEYISSRCLAGEFKGVNTFLNYLLSEMPTPRYDGSSGTKGKRGGFHYFASYEEALETYIHNPQKVRNFTEKDESLDGGEASGREVQYDVTGDFLDIGRFLDGEPEVFGSMTNGNPRSKRVQVMLNLSWWCEVEESIINTRCARLARLIDWLESQQIRCRLVAIESTAMSHLEIIVKDFDEVLDINDIAVVSHSDFLRRSIFRFKEWSETPQWGYGSSRVFSESIRDKHLMPEYNTEYSILVDSQVTSVSQVNKAFDDLEKWVVEKIAEDGLSPNERVKRILK